MKPYQLLGVTSAAPSPLRPQPIGLFRSRGGRSLLLLLALGLALALLRPACAADGDLDPSFITGPGPYAGVEVIPEIQGQVNYPTVTGSPFNGYSLVFGQFFGMTVDSTFYPRSGIARLRPDGSIDNTFVSAQTIGEIRSAYIYPHDDPNFPDKILIGGDIFASSGASYSITQDLPA
jgi:hypothetical protein